MRINHLAATMAAFSCVALAAGALAQTSTQVTPAPGKSPAPAETPAPAATPGTIPKAPSTTGAAAAATPAVPADPVVARVGSTDIHMSDVQAALTGVPQQYRQMPPQMLYPMVLDQVVDRAAVAELARKQGLQNDPQVKEAMERAADGALSNALVSKIVRPQVSDAAVHAKYNDTYANKPGEEEVHARHILVASEDKAKQLIDQLNKGADFAALAKANSTDPGAAQGGDLGWFKKGDMLPEFSAVAFALKPGTVSPVPVHTRYGWHVIKVEGTRVAPPPTFEQAQPEIRQQIIQAAVQKVVEQARAAVKVEKFNPDGSVPQPQGATPTPVPGAAAPGAAAPSAPSK